MFLTSAESGLRIVAWATRQLLQDHLFAGWRDTSVLDGADESARTRRERAQYVVTGHWGKKAADGSCKFRHGGDHLRRRTEGFRDCANKRRTSASTRRPLMFISPQTRRSTGLNLSYDVDAGGVPVVCDVSSNILSKPFDIEKYAVLYAGGRRTSDRAV